jgi:predicted Zn-dependent protease
MRREVRAGGYTRARARADMPQKPSNPPDPHTRAPDSMAPAVKHFRAGRLDEAERLLRRLLQRGDAPDDAPLLLAQILIDQQKPAQAEFELERVIRARPGALEPKLMLGKVWMAAGEFGRAAGLLKEATAAHPGSAEALVSLGTASLELGRVGEAEACPGAQAR